MDSAPIIQINEIPTPDKEYSRSFNLSSNKKNEYKISIYNQRDKLILSAINLNSKDIKSNEYKKEIIINELKNNKYLSLCESTNDMLEELFNLIDNKKYSLTEDKDNELIFHIEVPMKLIKEISFNLEKKEKDTNTIINDLIAKNNELTSKIDILSLQSKDIKDDIDYLKFKNNENKLNDLFNQLNDKINNLELKINEKNLDEQKEKNKLISQVNILTQKVVQLEKDIEQEKVNNKKILEKLNQIKTPNTSNNNDLNNDSNNKNNDSNDSPPFHTSKSDNLPNILFKSILGGILGKSKSKLGRKGRSKLHEHVLIFSDYTMKDPFYAIGNYSCDNCKQSFTRDVDNFHCKPCHYDLCEKCFELSEY